MAKRSRGGRRSSGRVAQSVVDTILGEAVGERKGFKPSRAQRYNDMLHIASTIYNRSVKTGLPPDQMLTSKEFNAYKKALPGGVDAYRSIAQQAWDYVNLYGPVTNATFYATPATTKNLPKGLKPAAKTVGHQYFTDPQDRPIGTQKGYKGPPKAPQGLPDVAPVPSSRPLDGVGGLGAAYRTAARGRVAPSSPAAPVGERFGQASPAPTPAPSRFGAVTAQDDVPMQAQPRSPPMGAVSGPLGPIPQSRMPDQSQRFRPDAAPAAVPTPTARPDYASPQQRMAGVAPPSATVSNMLAGRNMPVSPAPTAKMAIDPAKMYSYAGLTRSLAPAAPVSRAPATVATAPAPAPAPAQAQTRSIAAPAPSVPSFAGNQVVDTANQRVAAANTMNNMMTGQNMPVGPAQAPPAALAAARNLGTAIAAKTPAAIPPDVRQTAAYASMPPGTPAALAEKISQPQPRQVAAAPQVAQTTQQRPAGGLPAGVAGPWGADISMQQPAVDKMTTQSTAQPTTFGEKLTNAAQRYGPQIAGTILGGPVGGLIGGLLGRSFDAAKPGQVFGNPFQGLGNTARAMGLFQSGTPYAGPISNYGTGLRAIGDVLGGAAPVGSRAYSRSTPGYSVTALPGGTIQRTNQYGFTSFERPSMGPTASSFPGGFSSAPGGVFSGGGFGWGGGQSGGKTGGGRTSGGKSSSGKSSGGRKSERSESAGY